MRYRTLSDASELSRYTGVAEEQAVAFRLGFHDEKEDDTLHESKPFIVFKRTRFRAHGPK
jgi:hypothetical protein